MFKKIVSKTFIAFILLFSVGWAVAHETDDPLQVLEKATTDIVEKVNNNKTRIDHEPDYILCLIEEIIFPHVDFDYMSRWVVGRSMWKKASDDEQESFQREFKTLLLRTYANVVKEYANEKIIYYPIRSDYTDKKRIQVSSSITQANREPIDVVYRLVLSSEADWRLYDIVIEGVSLLKGFQSQFYDTLRHAGVAGLVEELKQHNLEDKEKRHAEALAKQKEKENEKGEADVGS